MVPYVTNRGGPLTGLEALSLQGIPVDDLILTRESEDQLADLAGNAMTSTVVGSAIVAALIENASATRGAPWAGKYASMARKDGRFLPRETSPFLFSLMNASQLLPHLLLLRYLHFVIDVIHRHRWR
jgi:hypothetical protein